MKAFLSLGGLGYQNPNFASHFPGQLIGWNGDCAGEIIRYQSSRFAPELLTDPSYLGSIAVIDTEEVEDRWPMPEQAQSFMPHLAGIVVLGRLAESPCAGGHFTLRHYLAANRICGFIPDQPYMLRRALESSDAPSGIISRDPGRIMHRRESGALDIRAIASPQEYFWDLAPGPLPAENINLVVWDFGANYGLLGGLRRAGASLRVVPPDTEPERIIALHPDGVVIAGGPFWAVPADVLSRIERLIGIRPVLAAGSGAILAAHALGLAIEKLHRPHYGAEIAVESTAGEVVTTYQAHTHAVTSAALEKAACRITHVNAADRTVEGFTCPDYDLTAVMFTMTSEGAPALALEFLTGMKREINT
jgi:carbamoyl-phosphate synthase small subunit